MLDNLGISNYTVYVVCLVVVITIILTVAMHQNICTAALIALMLIVGIKVLGHLQENNESFDEHFTSDLNNALKPHSVDGTMGPYDGLKLETCCQKDGGWRHPPCNVPLQVPTRQNSTVQGHQVPLVQPKPSKIEDDPATPSVNGDPNGPKSKFVFAFNQSRPECCPSTYSTSSGCVCTTAQQRNWIANRGRNAKCGK